MPDFFASPSGNDANPGTEASPVRSFERLATLAKAAAPSAAGDIVCWLGDGEYAPAAETVFGPADKAAGFIRFRARNPGRAVFTNRIPVTGWVATGPRRFSAVIGPGLAIRHIWIGSVPSRRATAGKARPQYRVTAWNEAAKTLTVSKEAGLPALAPGMILVLPQMWSLSHLPIAAVVDNGATWTVTPTPAARRAEFARSNGAYAGSPPPDTTGLPFAPGPYHAHPQYFWVENAASLLEESGLGSWYYDPATGVLTVLAPYGTTTVSDLEALGVWRPGPLVRIASIAGWSGSRAGRVTFEDLRLSRMSWGAPATDGYVGYAAGIYGIGDDAGGGVTAWSWGTVPSLIDMSYAEDVAITGCEFDNLGLTAVTTKWGCRDIVFSGNAAHDCAGSIFLAPGVATPFDGLADAEQSLRISATDNIVRRCCLDFGSEPIALGAARGARVMRNDLRDLPDGAIDVGTGARIDPNWLEDYEVSHNVVERVMQITADGAAIYANGNLTGIWQSAVPPAHHAAGARIYHNVVRDVRRGGWSPGFAAVFYLDLGSQGVLVTQNDVEDCDLFLNLNCEKFNRIEYNHVARVEKMMEVAYAGCNRIRHTASGYSILFYAPPVNAYDSDRFWGVPNVHNAFSAVFPFTHPSQVFNADGSYRTLSIVANNTELHRPTRGRVGPRAAVRERFAELMEGS